MKKVVIVMGPGDRNAGDLAYLRSKGAEIVMDKNTEHADRIFASLVREEHAD